MDIFYFSATKRFHSALLSCEESKTTPNPELLTNPIKLQCEEDREEEERGEDNKLARVEFLRGKKS